MYINNIQNYNTSFGAKLNIEGYSKDIKNSVIKQWTKKAELIGSEKDILTLKLGKPEVTTETLNRILNPQPMILKSRNVRMESIINNKKEEKILGYHTSEDINIHRRMINRINSYLELLAKKN